MVFPLLNFDATPTDLVWVEFVGVGEIDIVATVGAIDDVDVVVELVDNKVSEIFGAHLVVDDGTIPAHWFSPC